MMNKQETIAYLIQRLLAQVFAGSDASRFSAISIIFERHFAQKCKVWGIWLSR